MQGASIDAGIIVTGNTESSAKFTLWAAGSWKRFNHDAAADFIEGHLKKRGHPDGIVLGVSVGLYIIQGTLKAQKETAFLSRTVKIYCDCDGKTGRSRARVDNEDGHVSNNGDLFWKTDVD